MQGGSYFLVTLLCYLLPSPTPLVANWIPEILHYGEYVVLFHFQSENDGKTARRS